MSFTNNRFKIPLKSSSPLSNEYARLSITALANEGKSKLQSREVRLRRHRQDFIHYKQHVPPAIRDSSNFNYPQYKTCFLEKWDRLRGHFSAMEFHRNGSKSNQTLSVLVTRADAQPLICKNITHCE